MVYLRKSCFYMHPERSSMALSKYLVTAMLLLFLAARTGAQPVTVTRSEVKVTENGVDFFVHTVAPGHTLFSIARAYEVDQAEIIRYNPQAATGLQAGQILKIPDVSKTGTTGGKQENGSGSQGITHIVAAGETLFGIARKYGIQPQEIIRANPQVASFDNLAIGQELLIPVARQLGEGTRVMHEEKDSVIMHQVQKGESLYGIAQLYKTIPDSIIAWNPVLKEKTIKKGMDLRIIIKVISSRPVEVLKITPEVIRYDTVLHRIQDKETIWGLARRYNTTVDKIMELNPELKDGLKTGYYIYVPVPATGEKTAEPAPMVRTSGCENSRFKTKYKVALLIPLYLDEIDRITIPHVTDDLIRKPYFKSFSFLEFYQGVMIAADSMKKAGLSVDIHVFDTANDTMQVKKILAKPEMAYMDLIIGPFFLLEYNLVAAFAVKNQIRVVSPFARNNTLLSQHNNLFQLNAASDSKIAELARHIAKTYPDPNVIFVISNNEEDRELSRTFRSNLEAYAVNQTRKPQFAEVVYSEKGMTGVSTHLDATRTNIIVNLITGETSVSNYISGIARLSKTFNIIMFGMPEWRDYRTFDLGDLMLVNLHLFSNTFVDYSNPNTIAYLSEYRHRYKGEPDEDHYGFMGYDVALYFFRALYEFGLDFENCLPQLSYNPVSTGFRWKQVNGQGYENIHLNLYRYNDYNLEPVKQAK